MSSSWPEWTLHLMPQFDRVYSLQLWQFVDRYTVRWFKHINLASCLAWCAASTPPARSGNKVPHDWNESAKVSSILLPTSSPRPTSLVLGRGRLPVPLPFIIFCHRVLSWYLDLLLHNQTVAFSASSAVCYLYLQLHNVFKGPRWRSRQNKRLSSLRSWFRFSLRTRSTLMTDLCMWK
jgi:hypothetical protein